ncbi:hypothetical protein EA187_18750 [Lujinxingia sediminis]|uniref:Uncharacterized protein n=1 Tax=Lujinxingia sediminis TaxID=2480984 RepID=A0ABY0CNY7_9DELT|nr:hypothetical protein [Lujinxingia sediminis]RVU41384.1 hypothetical protein EA187_18750 [Lujinxingia sediminis]
MGVLYLLIYIFGAIFVWVGSYRVLDDVLAGEPLMEAMQIGGFGVLMIVQAAILHAVVLHRRRDAGVLEAFEVPGRRWFGVAAAAWLAPILVAWAQFEWFVDPIRMFPVITVGGASALVMGGVSRLLRKHRLRWPLTIAAVALVGLPVGLLTVSLPMSHFNYHLSSVQVSMFQDHYGGLENVVFEADDPDYIAGHVSPIGEQTSEWLSALANAEEVDISEEIAAGRMRRLEDGTLVRVGEHGEELRLHEWASVSKDIDMAMEADRAQAAAEEAKRRAEWEVEIEKRRQGGRLFR